MSPLVYVCSHWLKISVCKANKRPNCVLYPSANTAEGKCIVMSLSLSLSRYFFRKMDAALGKIRLRR